MCKTPSCCRLPDDAPFHSYEDVLDHLNHLGLFHMDMGLGRMEGALKALGLDELQCPAVQIVGTNGKGSTSVFLQSIAMAHGLNVGIYNSPHFVYPEERIRMNHTMLPRRVWPNLASCAVSAESGLTYFELLTVMATQAFQSSDCDLMIFEAGLGGRYDATTALPAEMICFVPMGMDHMNVLGSTLAEIADDKSDALRPGIAAAISAPQPDEVWDILVRKSQERNIPLYSTSQSSGISFSEALSPELQECLLLDGNEELGLLGPHQYINAQTAVLAWVTLCQRHQWKTDRKTIARGLRNAFIPGRLQFVSAQKDRPALWLDGAHNVHGMTALLNAVRSMPEDKRPGAVVFSCLADKEPEALTSLLRSVAPESPIFVPTIADNPRAASGTELVRLIGTNAQEADTLPHALEAAYQASHGKPVLICGSLYLLSEFFAMHPELLTPQS